MDKYPSKITFNHRRTEIRQQIKISINKVNIINSCEILMSLLVEFERWNFIIVNRTKVLLNMVDDAYYSLITTYIETILAIRVQINQNIFSCMSKFYLQRAILEFSVLFGDVVWAFETYYALKCKVILKMNFAKGCWRLIHFLIDVLIESADIFFHCIWRMELYLFWEIVKKKILEYHFNRKPKVNGELIDRYVN